MRKPDFCLCENKGADQLRSNCEADQRLCFRYKDSTLSLLLKSEISSFYAASGTVHVGLCQTWLETPGCPVLLFFLFFPIFSGLPIFSYILIPNPIFFHQIPIFFKMLQIKMKYQGKNQGKIMEFWFEMPVLMSLAFIFFLARFARS